MDLEHEMFRSFLAVFSVCQNTFAACGSGFRKSVMVSREIGRNFWELFFRRPFIRL